MEIEEYKKEMHERVKFYYQDGENIRIIESKFAIDRSYILKICEGLQRGKPKRKRHAATTF